MMFDSREAFVKVIEELKKPTPEEFRQWSDPIYPCPKCGGNMNIYDGRVLTSLPPIQQSEYQCEQCGFTEYI